MFVLTVRTTCFDSKFENVKEDSLDELDKAEEFLKELLIQQADAIIDSCTGTVIYICLLQSLTSFLMERTEWLMMNIWIYSIIRRI